MQSRRRGLWRTFTAAAHFRQSDSWEVLTNELLDVFCGTHSSNVHWSDICHVFCVSIYFAQDVPAKKKKNGSSLQQVVQVLAGCKNVPKGVDKVSADEQIHGTTREMKLISYRPYMGIPFNSLPWFFPGVSAALVDCVYLKWLKDVLVNGWCDLSLKHLRNFCLLSSSC